MIHDFSGLILEFRGPERDPALARPDGRLVGRPEVARAREPGGDPPMGTPERGSALSAEVVIARSLLVLPSGGFSGFDEENPMASPGARPCS